VASLLLAGQGQLSLGPLDLAGSYEAAGRKFLRLPSEDTLAQQLELEVGFHPLPTLQAGLEGRIKDRRGGPRVYTDLLGMLFLRWRAVAPLDVELRAGAHRFIDWPVFPYSFSAPEASARVRYRFDRRHAVAGYGLYGQRRYNASARPPPGGGGGSSPQRMDAALGVGAGYTYRGPFQLSAEYGYSTQDSNSYGETVRIHRLEVAYGMRLPWEWMLLAQVGLQLAEYPDGVFISEEFFLREDDERHNALAIKLARPLSPVWDLELRYGLYLNWFPQNGLSYVRHLGSVGVAFRL
jgi:hypothetical protein